MASLLYAILHPKRCSIKTKKGRLINGGFLEKVKQTYLKSDKGEWTLGKVKQMVESSAT